MTKNDFDPRNLGLYTKPKHLLHFQWQDDNRVYRYALVEIINEANIQNCVKKITGITSSGVTAKNLINPGE